MYQPLTTEVELSPDISHLVTEDDTPVDNLISEKQQRLLVEPLYSNRSVLADRPFLLAANVGVFYAIRQPPIVPDVFLSLNVEVPQDWREKKNRTYFIWEFGKPPDVAIEIVSNKEGNELDRKLQIYANIRVSYYVVFDPLQQLGERVLQCYELRGNEYELIDQPWLEKVKLGLTLWQGEFEGKSEQWLRWCDRQGSVIPTGAERADQAEMKLHQLTERLRSMGLNPDDLLSS